MNFYGLKQLWKSILLFIAIAIGISSLLYTNSLVNKLADEERKKIEIYAEAQEFVALSESYEEVEFYLKIVEENTTIPVLVLDSLDNIKILRNIDTARFFHNERYRKRFIKRMKESEPIDINISENVVDKLYYGNSILLLQLTYYPYIQLGVILLFIVVSYFAFSYSRKAEQNKVWVGLSKETAHQLGTPISSLMAWYEIVRMKIDDEKIISELEKDIRRLEKITERFSKIGSRPLLKIENVNSVILTVVAYLRTRSSSKVSFETDLPLKELKIPLNVPLFEWVIENVCKNSMDAIEGNGSIRISVKESAKHVTIDISDTGRGIHKRKHKTIFKPGFTTKQRGWGLGLSLTKRIVEEYHDGKIFVHSSEINKGTVFRLILNKKNNEYI